MTYKICFDVWIAQYMRDYMICKFYVMIFALILYKYAAVLVKLNRITGS